MEILKVGKIVNTHGIKGEVKIYPYTNDVSNLSKIKYIYLDDEKVNILNSKTIKNMIIFKLDNFDTVDNAKSLINKYIYIEKEEIDEEDTYYVEDLIGLEVFEDDKYIGKIMYVHQNGGNDVYEIEREDKSKIYLPAIKQVILNINLQEKKVLVKIMEGLE